jgi:hypothetical protein
LTQSTRISQWTRGSGPGTRQELLNVLSAHADGDWLVHADDDVEIPAGAFVRLFAAADAAGLAVAQLGHAARSHAATRFVRAVPGLLARRTGFVEMGPIVAMRTTLRDVLLPMDESLVAGWGQDYLWARKYADHGIRAGIVDGVRMNHLVPPGTAYNARSAEDSLRARLARARYSSHHDPLVTYDRWWWWQPRP